MKKMKIIVFSLTVLLAAGAFLAVSAGAKTASSAAKAPASKTPVSKTIAAVKATTTKAAVKATTTVAKVTTTKAAVKPAAKTTAKTTTVKKTTSARVAWTSAALRLVNRIPSGVRPAYKKKVEAYAIRNKIKTITPAVVNGLRE